MRKKASRKGENGQVLVIAGSEDYPGAAYLSGLAALRMGADLVVFAVPEKVAWTINSLCPDLITKKIHGKHLALRHYEIISPLIMKSDVLLIGPGLGQDESTRKLIRRIVATAQIPKVIDADAIKALRIQDISDAIITPHKKEYDILLKNSNISKDMIKKHINDNVIILKGPTDIIISKEKTRKIKGGNPGMTVGGTGDILSGLCAGNLSQGTGKFESAVLSAKLMGTIGDKLKKKYGYGFIASDFLGELAKINNK